jgi:hypothetical protein
MLSIKSLLQTGDVIFAGNNFARFLEKYIDHLNIPYITLNPAITEEFFDRHPELITCTYWLAQRGFSEEFYWRHEDKIAWHIVRCNTPLSLRTATLRINELNCRGHSPPATLTPADYVNAAKPYPIIAVWNIKNFTEPGNITQTLPYYLAEYYSAPFDRYVVSWLMNKYTFDFISGRFKAFDETGID